MVSGARVQVPPLYAIDYYFVFKLHCLLIWGMWPIPIGDIRSRVWALSLLG